LPVGYVSGMNRPILVAVGLAALLAAGCSNAPTTNSPGPAVTQAEQVANDALQIATIEAKLIGVDPNATTTVGVSVHDGVATLRGTVKSIAIRARVVATAREVSGIHDVRDELRVNPSLPTVGERVGDAALAARITGAVLMQTGSTGVNVTVRDGVATLTGSVAPNVRDAALATAHHTGGVHVVVDRIAVR
jgi:osmotically-inducible protein OsmY